MKCTPKSVGLVGAMLAIVGFEPPAFAGPCPDIIEGPEVVLRDSIGAGTAWTDEQRGCSSLWSTWLGNWTLSPVVVTPVENVLLKRFEWVGYPRPNCQSGCSIDMDAWDYELGVWSSVQAIPNSLHGNISSTTLATPSAGPLAFGVGPPGLTPPAPFTYFMAFDLGAAGIPLAASIEYVVGLRSVSNIDVAGFFRVSSTLESGIMDWWYSDGFPSGRPANECAVSHSSLSGRHAIKIVAVTYKMRGDLDSDGSRSVNDVLLFVEALLDPVAWPVNHPTIPLEVADMNCDGNVNGLDISGFVDKLLTP